MLVSTPVRTVPRFDRVALAQAASPAPPRAAGVVPRATVGLFDVLLENTRLLFPIIVVHVVTSVAAVPSDSARVVAAPSAIPSLYLCALPKTPSTTAPRARASAAATAAVERADEALLYARLGLPIVVGDIKPVKLDQETV